MRYRGNKGKSVEYVTMVRAAPYVAAFIVFFGQGILFLWFRGVFEKSRQWALLVLFICWVLVGMTEKSSPIRLFSLLFCILYMLGMAASVFRVLRDKECGLKGEKTSSVE